MLKYISQRTGTCYMRCTGMDAINSTGVVSYEVDQKYGTHYHEKFLEYVLKSVACNFLLERNYSINRLLYIKINSSDG